MKEMIRAVPVILLLAAAGGCGKQAPTARERLLSSFEYRPGQAFPWGGGTIYRGHASEGGQSYQVVFRGPRSGFFTSSGALPADTFQFRKLLFDVYNPSAPLLVHLILGGRSKKLSAMYRNIWIPYGNSTVEVDLDWARSSIPGKEVPGALQVGPEISADREIEIFVDNIRLSMTGAPPGGRRKSEGRSGKGKGNGDRDGGRDGDSSHSMIANSGFEEGFSGWTPQTWGPVEAAFSLVAGPEAHEGNASAAIFHYGEGPAGLLSPELHLSPGRYRLCLAVRAPESQEIVVERMELGQTALGDLSFKITPVGTLEGSENWEEKTLELEIPPENPASPDARRTFQLIIRFKKGDLFLDSLELVPVDPEKGGPAEPVSPLTMNFLAISPALRIQGEGEGLARCADLSPALLGGGNLEGAARMARRCAGDKDIRLWLIDPSGGTLVFPDRESAIGLTPAEIRAARKYLAGIDGLATHSIAVVARADWGGALETLADTADVLAGGVPLRAARSSGGLRAYAEGLKALQRAAGIPGREGKGSRRPAAAWIDLRVSPGDSPATPGELRAMAYLALAYSCDALIVTPFQDQQGAAGLQQELKRIADKIKESSRELEELSDVRTVETSDRRIFGRMGRLKSGFLLMLVNLGAEAVENVVVDLPPQVPGGRARNLGPHEGRLEKIEPR